MNIYLTIFLYILFGLISGVFGGLGMGGGTILIPMLTIFLGMEQKLCQGINLVSFLVMALFSLIIHYRHGYIVTKGVWFIEISGVIFSILGACLAAISSTSVLRMAFGIFLCVLAIIQGIIYLKNNK